MLDIRFGVGNYPKTRFTNKISCLLHNNFGSNTRNLDQLQEYPRTSKITDFDIQEDQESQSIANKNQESRTKGTNTRTNTRTQAN